MQKQPFFLMVFPGIIANVTVLNPIVTTSNETKRCEPYKRYGAFKSDK